MKRKLLVASALTALMIGSQSVLANNALTNGTQPVPLSQLSINDTLKKEKIVIDNPVDLASNLVVNGQVIDGGLLTELRHSIAQFGMDVTQNKYGMLELTLENQIFVLRPNPNSIKPAPAHAEPGVVVLEDGSFIIITAGLIEVRLHPSLRDPKKAKKAFADVKNSTDFELRVTDTGKTLLRDLGTQTTRTGTSIIVNWSYNVFPSGGRSGHNLRAKNPLLQSMTFNYGDGTAQQANAGVLLPDSLVQELLKLPNVISATEQANGTFKFVFTEPENEQQFESILYPQFNVQLIELDVNQAFPTQVTFGQRDDLIYQVKFDNFGVISRLAIETKALN